MRSVALVSLLLYLAVVGPAHGQTDPEHVFLVSTYMAHPGQEAAYNRVLTEKARPVLAEAIRRGAIVSYQFLQQSMGAGENTHLVIIEFPSWAAVGNLDQEEAEIAREIFDQSFAEWSGEFRPLREFIRSEIYTSP